MCLLCLQDFEFELPVEPKPEQKKKRMLKIKSMLQLASQLSMTCESKVEELKAEQYELSREF
jgi:hypothetical protein